MTSPSLPVAISSELPAATAADVLAELAGHRRLTVRQKKRWLDVLFNWESKNAYGVYDEEGQHTLQVREEGNGFVNVMKRLFFRQMRPFTSTVWDNPIPKPMMRLRRPFRFFFHQLDVTAADGTVLGHIERKWSWIRRIYTVHDESGREVATLFGPFFRPWTFEIQKDGAVVGVIRKRWSGFGKELFTDADNFGVELDNISDPKLKALCFAATVLIDVVHFERAKSHG